MEALNETGFCLLERSIMYQKGEEDELFDTVAMLSCGESVALMLNSVITDTGLTLSFSCMLLCIAQTMAGIRRRSLPQPIDALDYIFEPNPVCSCNSGAAFFPWCLI